MIKKGIRTLLKKEHLIINHHTITILVFPQSLTGFAFLRISILWKQIDICLMMSTTSMN